MERMRLLSGRKLAAPAVCLSVRVCAELGAGGSHRPGGGSQALSPGGEWKDLPRPCRAEAVLLCFGHHEAASHRVRPRRPGLGRAALSQAPGASD